MIGCGAVTCRGSGCPSAGPEPTPDGPGVLPDVPPRRGGLSDHPGPTGRDRIAGFEVVECAPPLEESDRTAEAAARAVAHFLAGYEGGSDE